MYNYKLTCAYLFILLTLIVRVLASPYQPGIRIIHVNDVHSRLTPHDYDIPGTNDIPVLEKVGGAAYMATKILELKSTYPGAVFVDAGDTSEGSILGDLRSNGGLIDFYKELDRKLELLGGRGIDASVVGNHDVRYAEMLTNMRSCTNFPFISMNIIELATGQPYFDPYVIVEADGKKIGILGYTTDTSSHLGPETELLIRVDKCGWDEGDIHIKDFVDHLRNIEACDVVLLLVHVGHSRVASNNGDAYQLVKDDGLTKPPEVVIGGHWHTMTPTVWQPAILNYKTIIAEAASYCQYVGEIELDDDGSYIDSNKHVIRNADISPDLDILTVIDNLIAEYNISSNKVYNLDQVIGYSAVDLRLNKNKWWSHNEFPWAGDNTAGAWIADSMQWFVDTQTPYTCDLALQSGGGVRRDNAAGPITFLEIYETYPWQDDNMVLIDALGSEIWSFIQNDYVGTSISKDWEVYAHDGKITNITYNGVSIDINATYQVVVSDYMYTFDNNSASGGWSDDTPTILSNSIRQSVIDYTSQFGVGNPMEIPGPRYHLNTGHAGRYRAVVTMIDDSDTYGSRQPYHESAYVRLLSATDDTVLRRGGYASEDLVNADGSINTEHRLSECMLYRSYLGFKKGTLIPGTILNIQVESGFHGGNPQMVEQTGILSDGVEFDIVDTNLSLAIPDYKGSIGEFWNEWHENHYVVFEGVKVGNSQVRDRRGQIIPIYTKGGYDRKSLPGNVNDLIELKGVQTYEDKGRRFRCGRSSVIATAPVEPDYKPYSSVMPILPVTRSGGSLTLHAVASDATEEAYITLLPTDDATVADGNPYSSNGTNTTLFLQSATATASSFGDERIWTQFDLSGLPVGAVVESARLQLYCWSANDSSAAMLADIHGSSVDSWDESSLTWYFQPSYGSVLDTTTLKKGEPDLWYTWDVTGFVANEAAGDDVASLVVKPQVEDSSVRNGYRFDSKEYSSGSKGPFLQLETSGGPVLGGSVTNVAYYYRYSSDKRSWDSWLLYGHATHAPWEKSFSYPNGYGWYEFYSVATDNTGNAEPVPIKADSYVHYVAGVNTAPQTPVMLSPTNNATGITQHPILKAQVTDTDADQLDVSFYDASGNELIKKVRGVFSGSIASAMWTGLEAGTNHTWYVVVDDGTSSTTSGVWNFTAYTIDSDGDAIADEWELQYFSDLTHANAVSDWDGDGFIDLHEYRAGTDPTNGYNLLAVYLDEVLPGGSNIVVSWPSVVGKAYALQQSSDLVNKYFIDLITHIPATPPNNIVTNNVGVNKSLFYRVIVEED